MTRQREAVALLAGAMGLAGAWWLLGQQHPVEPSGGAVVREAMATPGHAQIRPAAPAVATTPPAMTAGPASPEPGRRIPARTAAAGHGGAVVEVVADRLVVELTDPGLAGWLPLEQGLADNGFELLRLDAQAGTAWVGVPASTDLDDAALFALGLPGVAAVRLDPIAHGAGKGAAAAAPEPSLWHLAALRMDKAWDKQPTCAPVVVALLDTGLTTDPNGQALAPGLDGVEVLPGYDFVNLDSRPDDDNGHGTLLASILASKSGILGVAPGVTLLPVKVLDANRLGGESALAAGIDFAVEAGAHVISMSLAFPAGFVPSAELGRAVQRAERAGVVMLGAAGNNGAAEIAYPAAFGEVVAVGAGRLVEKVKPVVLGKNGKLEAGKSVAKAIGRAEYSARGAPLDLLGPGGSMQHDLDGDGLPDAVPGVSFSSEAPGQYGIYLVTGTSPATVQLAGVAALLLAAGAPAADVRAVLQAGATDLPNPGFDTFTGAGMADAARSVARASHGHTPVVPARFVNPVVTLAEDSAGRRHALAFVELVDAQSQPVGGATVLGHFRGPVVHDVSAVTDAQGRALVASLAAPGDAAAFELGIDKILEPLADEDAEDDEVVRVPIVPRAFARFELASFRWLSSFQAEGAGIEPSPFAIAINPWLLQLHRAPFASGMILGAEPAPGSLSGPLATLPEDVLDWKIVPSVLLRSYGGAAGTLAPTAVAVERVVFASWCALAGSVFPVSSDGAGIEPSPFRVAALFMRDLPQQIQVMVRATSAGA
ncbi:MAG: S8 family serine peptidase, partial [Deltaproteobacteria bacterium]|nr:S8 family serine peptidase [Deltaproteobacteria bacterium]